MANICNFKFDPATKQFLGRVIDDASGDVVTTFGQVTIDLDDLTGTNKIAAFREFHFLDFSAGCAEKKAWFLMTEPETV